MSAASPVVQLDDVHLSFKGVKAVNGVSLHVEPGELFAIIGPNGAGKTSLFNVISGVYQPQEGRVRFQGQEGESHRVVEVEAGQAPSS